MIKEIYKEIKACLEYMGNSPVIMIGLGIPQLFGIFTIEHSRHKWVQLIQITFGVYFICRGCYLYYIQKRKKYE